MSKNVLQQSFDALVATAEPELEMVETSTGAVGIGGATVFEVIVLARDFKSLRGLFMGATSYESDGAAGAAFVDALIEEGPEAVASFIGVCAKQKKRLKDVVPAIMDKSDDDIELLLDASIRQTMPNGVSDFFGRVGKMMAKLGLTPTQTEDQNGSTQAAA